jgi:exodeoxyribonuclease V alpha subunit
MSELVADPFDVRRALGTPEALRAFNDAGVLVAADVHVAVRLAALAGEADPAVTLAAALAVRGPRIGHVYVDLATVRDTTVVDVDEPVDVGALPWPDVDDWIGRLGASPLVAVGEGAAAGDRGGTAAVAASDGAAPLRLEGTRLYLDRYWREERQLAADLRAFAEAGTGALGVAALDDGLARLFGGDDDGLQRLAAASAVRRRFAVVAGGPGTGKTTTVARIVALLAEQAAAAGAPPPLVALAAPTGKAAARLEEAVHDEAATLNVAGDVRAALLGLQASTLHRLLGRRRGSHSRFRHHRGNRLPHDVVVVDETSMVPLSLMARLVEAVRPEARLVLVGDPGQLSSIEAGAVLGDIVGEAGAGREGIVVLDRVHRFGGGIAALASAVRGGDADKVVEVLEQEPPGVRWVAADIAEPAALALVRERAVATARAVFEAAAAGRVHDALAALGAFRLLCAHRHGPYGAGTWMPLIESWLAAEIAGLTPEERWYVGRPLLVTENDYGLRLYNGDTGVVVANPGGRLTAAFERRGEVLEFSPSRLDKVETVYAMTIHKSQGSQFATAAVLLPDPTSRLLTRELLYTAITRAREELIVVGGEESIRAAVARPVARASGLGRLLWG